MTDLDYALLDAPQELRPTARPRPPTFEELAHSRGFRQLRDDLWLVAPGYAVHATTLEELDAARREALKAREDVTR